MTQSIGIILAGGSATRFRPVTTSTSKQLLPVYDKPVIYYPLTTMLLAGFREIALISNPEFIDSYEKLLGDGSHLGIEIQYFLQDKPAGLAQAFTICEQKIRNRRTALILGDNLFHGNLFGMGLGSNIATNGANVFAFAVENPTEFGIVHFDENGKPTIIEEKPVNPKSHWAIPGLYFYDETVSERAKSLVPSDRGELEITDLNRSYLNEGKLFVQKIPRGNAWLDLGTPDGLLDASEYVRNLQKRQGLPIGSPEEAAWRKKYIDDNQYRNLINQQSNDNYKRLLTNTLEY